MHILTGPHDVVGSPGIVEEVAMNAGGEISLAVRKAQGVTLSPMSPTVRPGSRRKKPRCHPCSRILWRVRAYDDFRIRPRPKEWLA
jgi:hypothetical protein